MTSTYLILLCLAASPVVLPVQFELVIIYTRTLNWKVHSYSLYWEVQESKKINKLWLNCDPWETPSFLNHSQCSILVVIYFLAYFICTLLDVRVCDRSLQQVHVSQTTIRRKTRARLTSYIIHLRIAAYTVLMDGVVKSIKPRKCNIKHCFSFYFQLDESSLF